MGRCILAIATLIVLACVLPAAAKPEFTDAERRRILAHGPWRLPPPRDPGNRVSGKPEAIALGERLFFDRRLSGTGTMACDWCHTPSLDWTDGFARGVGRQTVDRNTLSLWNAGFGRWFGWSGAHDSLWAQSIRPLLDAREMDMSAARVAERVRRS